MTPYTDVYKSKIQSDGSLEILKFRIVVIVYLNNKEIIGYNWDSTESMRNLKFFLSYVSKHKAIVHQLDLIGAFLQSNVKHRVFVESDIRYGEYFLTCSSPRRTFFLHALSFECTSKLCGTFLNQFSDYFHI